MRGQDGPARSTAIPCPGVCTQTRYSFPRRPTGVRLQRVQHGEAHDEIQGRPDDDEADAPHEQKDEGVGSEHPASLANGRGRGYAILFDRS